MRIDLRIQESVHVCSYVCTRRGRYSRQLFAWVRQLPACMKPYLECNGNGGYGRSRVMQIRFA